MRMSQNVAVVLLGAALTLTAPAHAQKKHQFAADTTAAYPMSAMGKSVVQRLHALERLPDADWSYHSGNIPHGEAMSLNLADWQKGHAPFRAEKGAVWFRRTIEVPQRLNGYSLEGASISFSFDVASHGAVSQIIYVDGRRIAMGEDLERITLFANGAGKQAVVAIKVPETADVKQVLGADLRIEYAPGRPSPRDIGTEFAVAARLLPMLISDPKDLQAKEAVLEAAMGKVNISALDRSDQAAFDASLVSAHTALDPLRQTIQSASIDLIGESHIDLAWLWPWTETVDVVRRTYATSLQLMREYPTYIYSASSAVAAEWMQEKYPLIFNEMKQRTTESRWEPIGGMWVEPDLIMPDGESIVRQLLVGKRYFQKELGYDVRVGWNPDSFGYPSQLPQIYKKSGVDYFMTHKLAWNETNTLPLKLFWWEAPDGSRILTYFPHEYGKEIKPLDLIQNLVDAKHVAPGEKATMQVYGVGDHGGGPTRNMLDEGLNWMQPDKIYPRMAFTTAISFFDDAAKHVTSPSESAVWNYKTLAAGNAALPAPANGQISVPVWKDELYLELHRGTYTSQAQHKKNMRDSEEWMLNAEKFAALAWLDGQSYPADTLNDAWKKILFNQFHDIAAGSGTATVYKDAQRDYDLVHLTTDKISAASLDELLVHVNTAGTPDSTSLAILNSLAWPRTDIVEADVQLKHPVTHGVSVLDSAGHQILVQTISSAQSTGQYHLLLLAEDVPALGYKVLHVVDAAPPVPSDLQVHGTAIENAFLKVEVDPTTGCITHLIDKKTGYDSIAKGGCANELQAFADNPKLYDAWNIDPGTLDHAQLISATDSVQIAEQGTLRAVIRIKRHWQSSAFVQDVILYAGIAHVDLAYDVDWHETHVLLKAAFPLASSGPVATFEVPYGTIQRPTTRDNSIDEAKFEVPALRWADLGDDLHGVSLLNDSKYGYDALGNVLRLSLLRSPVYPDPDADRGRQRFTFSLYPHAGTWQQALTVRRGYEFNYKLAALQVEQHDGTLPQSKSFVQVDDNQVVLTAMKKAEDGSALILRLYDWSGAASTARIALPGNPRAVDEVNLMEAPTGKSFKLEGNTVIVPVGPYEIKTISVKYQPKPATELSPSK